MAMHQQALRAYELAQNFALWLKAMEKMAFSRAVRLLRQARESEMEYRAYASALRFNQKLWTLIQASLAEDPGQMPDRLRTDILNLSLFIDRHTIEALGNPRTESLDPLIDINVNISGGLFPEPGLPAVIGHPGLQ